MLGRPLQNFQDPKPPPLVVPLRKKRKTSEKGGVEQESFVPLGEHGATLPAPSEIADHLGDCDSELCVVVLEGKGAYRGWETVKTAFCLGKNQAAKQVGLTELRRVIKDKSQEMRILRGPGNGKDLWRPFYIPGGGGIAAFVPISSLDEWAVSSPAADEIPRLSK
jgi:hypothetical protein